MRKLAFTVIALAAAALLDAQPSHAYQDGAWCAVSSQGRGGVSENCNFNNFEACRMEIVSGNRGFCRPNGYWSGNFAAKPAATRKAKKRHHR